MTASGLEREFAAFVERNRLISPSDRVAAALSGGVDSMVMLRLLTALREKLRFDLSVAHVNHGLRGAESDGDEEFVRAESRRLGLECRVHRAAPAAEQANGAGIQERARSDRYRFFESLGGGGKDADRTRVATAHHRDDNAETILFNFLRGSGIHGLTGIPVERSDGFIIRPLLFASRASIRAYAEERTVPFREDSSNAAAKYTRNALRLNVIPSIESLVNPGLRETLLRTSRLFADLESYVGAEVEKALPAIVASESGREIRLHAGRLGALPLFLRESLLLALSRRFNPYGIGYVHVSTLLGLIAAQSGSSCTLPGNLRAFRERDHLVLSTAPAGCAPFSYPVRPGERYDFGDFSFSSSAPAAVSFGASPLEEYVDADRLGDDLALRSWEDGDWFVPFGMPARKKLSDFFTDRKIAVSDKMRIPILVSGGDVVWVCGERLDDRFRVTPGTKRVLLLRFERSPR